MTFRKQIYETSSIFYSLIPGRKLPQSHGQLNSQMMPFFSNSMSCGACRALDVNVLICSHFHFLSLFKYLFFLLEKRPTAEFRECLQYADSKCHLLKSIRREQKSKVLLSGCSAEMPLFQLAYTSHGKMLALAAVHTATCFCLTPVGLFHGLHFVIP